MNTIAQLEERLKHWENDVKSWMVQSTDSLNKEKEFLIDQLNHIKIDLEELKKIALPENKKKITLGDFEVFEGYIFQYFKDRIIEESESKYEPDFMDAYFGIRYGNEVKIESVRVDVSGISRDIISSLNYVSFLEYVDNDNTDFNRLLQDNFDFFKKIYDRLEDRLKEIMPNGYHEIDDFDNADYDISYNDYDKTLELSYLKIMFGDFIFDGMDGDLESEIGEIVSEYYPKEEEEDSDEDSDDSESNNPTNYDLAQ